MTGGGRVQITDRDGRNSAATARVVDGRLLTTPGGPGGAPIDVHLVEIGGAAIPADGYILVRQFVDLTAGASNQPFFYFAGTGGQGTGTINATGNYAATPTEFYIQPPAGEVFVVHRVILTIRDGGNFNSNNYAGFANPLTNGISLAVKRGAATIVDVTGGVPIKTNLGWGRYSYDVTYVTFGVTGDNAILCRWTFANAGAPIALTDADRLAFLLNDNFTGIVQHYFNFQGYRIA